MPGVQFVKLLLSELRDVPVVIPPLVILAVLIIAGPTLAMTVPIFRHIPARRVMTPGEYVAIGHLVHASALNTRSISVSNNLGHDRIQFHYDLLARCFLFVFAFHNSISRFPMI